MCIRGRPTSIGIYDRDQFAVIPEFNLNVGYQLAGHLRGRVGYTFIYWTNVLRATEQIDTVINPTQFPLAGGLVGQRELSGVCLLYPSPSPRDRTRDRMPSSA